MEMASWFKVDKGYIFITDDDVYAWQDREGLGDSAINWHNMVGHYGILQVYKIPDNHRHLEGFVQMPDVIKKNIFDGKMDMLFAHAGNLREATPEFIPIMRRLANRFPDVESQLNSNPYRKFLGRVFTYKEQMVIGVENGFNGSTIGELIRHPLCDGDSMMVALKGARDYMDKHSDHHHYFDIMRHKNITTNVLQYIVANIPHKDVTDYALEVLKNPIKKKAVAKAKNIRKMTEKKAEFEGKEIVRSLS